jgi:hypothetical protein
MPKQRSLINKKQGQKMNVLFDNFAIDFFKFICGKFRHINLTFKES